MRATLIRILGALALATIGSSAFLDTASAQRAGETVEVILAIDTSESMEQALDSAQRAADEFVATMPVDVPIGVVTFADDVTVLTPPTNDRSLITKQINSITTGGDTALLDAVVTAAAQFSPTVDNKVIVLLSDGKDEGSESTIFDAVLAVEDIRVEAISLTTALTDNEILQNLGAVTSADDDQAMSAAFAALAGLLVEEVVEATAPPATVSSTVPATSPPTTVSVTTAPPATTVEATVGSTPDSVPAVVLTADDAEPSSAALWIGAIAIFGALFVGAVLVFPRERVSKVRLGVNKPKNVSEIGTRATSAIDEILDRHGRRGDLAAALAIADVSMKPAEFVAVTGLIALVVGCVGLFLGGPIVALLAAVAVAVAVRVYVRRAARTRQDAFAEQLPDVLQLVTTALRSGYGVTQALESVAEEAAEPARSEFAQVLAESRMGRDLSDSLGALARRMKSKDLEWVVSAIDINRETGGNLSEILDQVGVTIRERAQMARQVQTLTAEGRLSAKILTAMPFLLILWQWRVNPDNFELLTHGVGLVALFVAGILLVLGGLWVRKAVNSVAL